MSNELNTTISLLKIENNYLHHKIQQIFHEIQTQNLIDPIDQRFQSKYELLYASYQAFCRSGIRGDANLPDITSDEAEPE